MRNVWIVFKKQLKDTVKNKTILIQFVLFPIMTLIMENAISMEGMPKLYFTKLFSIMYIGMAPVTSVAAIISEEKETNTLRVLMMANVKPWQYLAGVGSYVWAICMAGAGVMASGLPLSQIPFYLSIMAFGFLLSVLAGAGIGISSRSQMKATSIVMPVMMLLAFLPMIGMFNEKVRSLARFFYTQRINECLQNMSPAGIWPESILVVLCNVVLLIAFFIWAYRKKGLE